MSGTQAGPLGPDIAQMACPPERALMLLQTNKTFASKFLRATLRARLRSGTERPDFLHGMAAAASGRRRMRLYGARQQAALGVRTCRLTLFPRVAQGGPAGRFNPPAPFRAAAPPRTSLVRFAAPTSR